MANGLKPQKQRLDMKVEIIEILLVCVIVSIQVWVFARTFIKIGVLRQIIPKIEYLKISKVDVPKIDLEVRTPKEILAKIKEYKKKSLSEPTGDKMVEVNVLESDVNTNYVFNSILFSVNNYLIRNRGASSDFNLIKDIVERNTNAVEEDINLSTNRSPSLSGVNGNDVGYSNRTL